MHAHYLQHVAFEGLGSIEGWLNDNGYTITSTKLFKSEKLPSINDIDLLIIMGGPMSVNDEGEFPWLLEEKRFIQSAIEAGKATLGICLGAQLIASALGASIFQNPEKEIGWFPIEAVVDKKTAKGSLFQFPDEVNVFHWHGETFNLPNKAIRLAKSEACDNQAFQVAHHVIGLQFHLETTLASAKEMIKHCGHELVKSKYVQTDQDVSSVALESYSEINTLMGSILEYLQPTNTL